jgi:quercetin dioxygenase-like cupin family protein
MSEPVRDPVSGVRMSFEPEGQNLIVTVWLEPGGGLPAHYHPKQEERWSVTEGTARFRLGDEWQTITPEDGEIAVLPGTVHALDSASDQEAKLRTLVLPALHLQSFLEESAEAAQQGLFNSKGLPRGLRGTRWAAQFLKRYREETVMVSPPQFVQSALFALFARGTEPV